MLTRLLAAVALALAPVPALAQAAGRVMPVPLVGSGAGLQSVMASGSSGVVATGPVSFYGVTVTLITGQGPGWLMIFDSATVPADGAVNPVRCVYVDAGPRTTVFGSSGYPLSLANGMSWAFSTGANCQTKAAAPANFVGVSFKVQAQ